MCPPPRLHRAEGPAGPVLHQARGFAAERGGRSFGGSISHFSIANQLFVSVTWVLGIMFVRCDGVLCLRLQGLLWTSGVLLDTGPVKWGRFGITLSQNRSALQIHPGAEVLELCGAQRPRCPNAPAFLSLYMFRVGTLNAKTLNADGTGLC